MYTFFINTIITFLLSMLPALILYSISQIFGFFIELPIILSSAMLMPIEVWVDYLWIKRKGLILQGALGLTTFGSTMLICLKNIRHMADLPLCHIKTLTQLQYFIPNLKTEIPSLIGYFTSSGDQRMIFYTSVILGCFVFSMFASQLAMSVMRKTVSHSKHNPEDASYIPIHSAIVVGFSTVKILLAFLCR